MATRKTSWVKIRNIAGAIVAISTLLGSAATLGWCKLAVPEVKKIVTEEQKPLVELTKELVKNAEFSNFLIMSDMSIEEIDSAKTRWKQYRMNGGLK